MPSEINPVTAGTRESVGRAYVPGVHAARAAAVAIVVLTHINGLWTNAEGFTWIGWRAWLFGIDTLHIDYQAGAHTGLLLFFLVSGYIVSQVAERESRLEFGAKRAARLIPAMVLAVALTVGVAAIGREVGWTEITALDPDRAFGPEALLEAFGLSVTFVGGTVALFPLWTLTVEYYWYVLLGAFIGVVRQRAVAATIGIAICVFGLTQAARFLDGPIFIGSAAFVFIILIGRWIYMFDRGQVGAIGAVAGALAMTATYGAVQWSAYGSDVISGSHPRLLSVAWSVVLFMLLLRLVKRGPARPVAFIADISYGLYLFHIPVMFAVLPIVSPAGRLFPLGILITAAATVLIAWLSYRYVETPTRRWVRRRIEESRAMRRQRGHELEPSRG